MQKIVVEEGEFMKGMLRHIPNCITCLRILGTVALLFTEPLSAKFFWVYLFTGVTDVLDGFIARTFNLTSEFGAKLDSVSDLLFYGVSLSMIMPVLWRVLPRVIWIAVAVVLLFRSLAYIFAAVRLHEFASSHSYLNKLTGLCVFAIPFVLTLKYAAEICWVFCTVSFISSFTDFLRFAFIKPKK